MHPSFLADPVKKRKEGKKFDFQVENHFMGAYGYQSFNMYVYSYNKALRNDAVKTPALGPRLAGECSLGMQRLGFCSYYQTGKQQTVTNFPPLFFQTP